MGWNSFKRKEIRIKLNVRGLVLGPGLQAKLQRANHGSTPRSEYSDLSEDGKTIGVQEGEYIGNIVDMQ